MYMGPIRAATIAEPVRRKPGRDLVLGVVALPFIVTGFAARLVWHFVLKDMRLFARMVRAVGEEVANARR